MARIKGLAARLMAEKIKLIFQRKKYAFFERGDYNLNIIGVRNKSGDASKFDDFINVIYKVNDNWMWDSYSATTEPGPSILRKPLASVSHKGTAILVPDQYRTTYQIGKHD